eukprot:350579-Chlamydomonas_euryale.AAC.1
MQHLCAASIQMLHFVQVYGQAQGLASYHAVQHVQLAWVSRTCTKPTCRLSSEWRGWQCVMACLPVVAERMPASPSPPLSERLALLFAPSRAYRIPPTSMASTCGLQCLGRLLLVGP